MDDRNIGDIARSRLDLRMPHQLGDNGQVGSARCLRCSKKMAQGVRRPFWNARSGAPTIQPLAKNIALVWLAIWINKDILRLRMEPYLTLNDFNGIRA